MARRGTVIRGVVERVLRQPYFLAAPPKSCGREEFGEVFVDRFLIMCREAGATDADVVATATALAAESILDAYRRFVLKHLKRQVAKDVEYVVAGGGAWNATLMAMLREGLEPMGVKVRTMDDLGVPAQAKEGMAFALLAWQTWSGLPGNVPSATGARRPVVLGKVTHG